MSAGTCIKHMVSFGGTECIKERKAPLSSVVRKLISTPLQPEKELDVSSYEETASTDVNVCEKDARREEEAEWISHVIEGDMDAFKNLFDRYYMRLRSVAYGILLNEEDAADVCQDAFFKAYKNLTTFRGQSSFYTWMYRIVYNLCIDLGRKSSRKRETVTSEISIFEQRAEMPHSEYFMPSYSSPEEMTYRGELAREIKKAMEALSPSHRAVVNLRELEGLSYEEISESLGCSVGTVMSRLFHARKKLGAALERALGEVSN